MRSAPVSFPLLLSFSLILMQKIDTFVFFWIMLICSFWSLEERMLQTMSSIVLSLIYKCLCVSESHAHTCISSQNEVFKSMLICRFSWNDNAGMIAFAVVLCKISTADGSLWLQKLHRNTTSAAFESVLCLSIQMQVEWQKEWDMHTQSVYTLWHTLTDDSCSMHHWAALVTDRLWQVSRSKQSGDCHL